MPYARLLMAPLLLALLVGCGAQARGTAIATAPDAQLAHTDGLLGGYAGKVASHNGTLALELVHQGLFTPRATFAQIFIATGLGALTTPLLLGANHQIYGVWSDPLKPGPDAYYPLGAFSGTPVVGQPLRYQLAPGAHLEFEKAHDDVLMGRHVPDATTLTLQNPPKPIDSTPVLVEG